MKNLLAFLLVSTLFISCTKETKELRLPRCGTVYAQPAWAKNFKPDSLFNITSISHVQFQRTTQSARVTWDTAFNSAVPISFLPGGIGKLSGNISFNYRINQTGAEPQLILFNIQDISPIFPFTNSFQHSQSITMTVEYYYGNAYNILFSNGVAYYSSNEIHENSRLMLIR